MNLPRFGAAILAAMFLLLLTPSCSHWKWIESHKAEVATRICISSSTTQYIEHTHDSIIYKKSPPDTVKIKEKVPCDDFHSQASSGNASVDIDVKNGVMKVNVICLADSLKEVIRTKDKEYKTLVDNKATYVDEIAKLNAEAVVKNKAVKDWRLAFIVACLALLGVGYLFIKK
jgi:hypothetical protein